MEVEVALLEEHGLTLPPETQPLRGLELGSQLNWRRAALYDTRRARAKRELLRGVSSPSACGVGSGSRGPDGVYQTFSELN